MKDQDFFRDKVILITGASSGIGRASAVRFAQLKAKVILASRNEEKLESLKREIVSNGGEALVIKTDVTSFEDTQKLVVAATKEWGSLDILIANAGAYIQDLSHEINIDSFRDSFDVNFFGVLNSVKSVLPEMKRQGKGHIVIINSLDSRKGIIGDSPYVAAKSALDGFGDVLRQELKGYGIRVTSIYPARVDTPMIGNIKVPWISPKISPFKVAKAIIKGIRRNKAIVVVPSSYFLLGALNNISPRLVDWFYLKFKIEGVKVE